MAYRSRGGAMGLGMAVLVALGTIPLVAQEPSPSPKTSRPDTSATRRAPARRVPTHFGQLGLTPEQREAIYHIQAKHQAKIADLEEQIAAAKVQMMTECEAVLTQGQKQMLEQRRRSGTKGSAKSAG